MKICKYCGLNPNDTQPLEQQKWEERFVKENGMCNACYNEYLEEIDNEN